MFTLRASITVNSKPTFWDAAQTHFLYFCASQAKGGPAWAIVDKSKLSQIQGGECYHDAMNDNAERDKGTWKNWYINGYVTGAVPACRLIGAKALAVSEGAPATALAGISFDIEPKDQPDPSSFQAYAALLPRVRAKLDRANALRRERWAGKVKFTGLTQTLGQL